MKKLGLLVLVLVVVVASLGVGYAWWSHTININGTVASANFAIDTSIVSNDPDTTDDPGMTPAIDVGSTDVTEVDTLNYTITIDNVYPGYTSTLTCVLTNTGDIPVKVYLSDFAWNSGSPALAAAIVAGSDYDTTYSEGAIIAVGQAVTVTINFAIPTTADNTIIGQSVSGAISFDVQQFNEP